MRTKKVRKSRQTFRSVGTSVRNSVNNGADGHVSDMRDPSVMPSVCDVGNSIGNGADWHVSDMRDPSAILSVFVQTDTCQTCVWQSVGDAVGFDVGKAVGNPSVNVAKSRNFFATLCEIPMGYIPLVYPSVIR
jgi:hypothetical protein